MQRATDATRESEPALTAAVEFRDLSKSYDETLALDHVNLTVAPGEFLTLLGPSGSGKTTLLNIISGMVPPTSGSVLLAGQDVTHVPPRQRGLGMVFQNYALLPHMTVFDNVAFPLRIRKMARAQIEREVTAALELVRLADFARRKPRELSGGQQQRVSIARCLVYKPRLILMDEPLGALDKKLRMQLQLEIKKIHEELGVTVLYVTHDQEEGLVLSDRICVMNHARIAQVGTPDELYFKPANEFVADFLGESNLIPAKVADIRYGIASVRTEHGSLLRAAGHADIQEGSRVKVMVRPEALRISTRTERHEWGIEGVIRDRIFIGQATRYVMSAGALLLTAQFSSSSGARSFTPGDRVWIDWCESDSILLPAH